MNKFTSGTLLSVLLIVASGCGNTVNSPASGEVRTHSLNDSPTPYPVSDSDRSQAATELGEIHQKMLILEGKLMAPAQEDLDQYSDFLKAPNSGLVRLFSRDTVSEIRPRLVNGQGAYYQFKGQKHDYGQGSDLEYSTKNSPEFSVGFAGVDIGFLGQLGKIDIRQIDDRNPTVASVLAYTSPHGQPELVWRAEQQKFSKGTIRDNITLKNHTDAIVGMSYVVRSINESGYDIVAIFQVIRRDSTDNSIIVAWKIVKEFEKPIMMRY